MSETFARRYKLQERIAVGGTAEVFHALFSAEDGDQRQVVIKRVLPQFARDERFRRLFYEEACVAVSITHPNIVRVLDFGELEQTCYIALERVDGMDLGSLLGRARESGGLPRAELVAFVGAQVGEALQFIHDQTSSEGTPLKIIHRDVSPQNILVSYSGDVKLTDFGIAKSAIRQETTVDGTLRGKLDYMAPEQAGLTDVDHRADLFALGCVLYELIQGVPPFRGENELSTLDRIRTNRIVVPPAQLDAPPPLRQILERALQPRREMRYQRADEMVRELWAFNAVVPASALREQLADWTRTLAVARETSKPDAVDHAVRQLLGEGIAAGPPPQKGTAIFASASAMEPTTRTGEQLASPVRSLSRPTLVLGVVAALGVCGWLFWAVLFFDRVSSSGAATDGDLEQRSTAAEAGRRFLPDAQTDVPLKVTRDTSDADSGPRWPTRQIAVRSSPAGAAVLVDGQPAGQTPLQLKLPERPFSLELRRAGHRAWSRRIDPRSAPDTLRVALPLVSSRLDVGYLTVNSLPWSRVQIDGTFVGNTPLIRMQLSAGSHRIELFAPDGASRKRFTADLRRGQRRSFTFDFTHRR